MKVAFNTTYYAGFVDVVDLPIDNWDQIEDYYIKWGTLFYSVKGEDDYREIDLEMISPEMIDSKRPATIEVFGTDETGEPDWNNSLDEYR